MMSLSPTKRLSHLCSKVSEETNIDYFDWFEQQTIEAQNFCLNVWDYFLEMPPFRKLNLNNYDDTKLERIIKTYAIFFRTQKIAFEFELDCENACIIRRRFERKSR